MLLVDPTKDARNIAERGISLRAFEDLDLNHASIIQVVRNNENREVIMAPIADRLYLAVITRRGDDIRVISLRKANSREERKWINARS